MNRKRVVVVFVGVWGGVLLLRWTCDAPRTAASREFFCGRSYALEDAVQCFSILRPRCCNALTHVSLLLAGGLCNRTIAASNRSPGREGFCDLGTGIANRFHRSFDRCAGAHSRPASDTVLGPQTLFVSHARRARPRDRGLGLHRGISAPNALARCSTQTGLLRSPGPRRNRRNKGCDPALAGRRHEYGTRVKNMKTVIVYSQHG